MKQEENTETRGISSHVTHATETEYLHRGWLPLVCWGHRLLQCVFGFSAYRIHIHYSFFVIQAARFVGPWPPADDILQ